MFFFAWFCNAAVHLGMGDISILRYARKPSYGWASAAGMYLGHCLAWVCAALLLIYWVKTRGTDPLKGEARSSAVADARQRAEQYAEAAGVKVGAVQSITESVTTSPYPYAASALAYDARSAAGAVPIQAGSQDVSVNVTITYAVA